jgi:hypothetical protein
VDLSEGLDRTPDRKQTHRRDSQGVSSRPIMLQNIACRDTKRALRRVRPGRIRRLGRALDREIRAMHAK